MNAAPAGTVTLPQLASAAWIAIALLTASAVRFPGLAPYATIEHVRWLRGDGGGGRLSWSPAAAGVIAAVASSSSSSSSAATIPKSLLAKLGWGWG